MPLQKEPALAKKAASDLEFAKYFTNTVLYEYHQIIKVRLEKNVPGIEICRLFLFIHTKKKYFRDEVSEKEPE